MQETQGPTTDLELKMANISEVTILSSPTYRVKLGNLVASMAVELRADVNPYRQKQ